MSKYSGGGNGADDYGWFGESAAVASRRAQEADELMRDAEVLVDGYGGMAARYAARHPRRAAAAAGAALLGPYVRPAVNHAGSLVSSASASASAASAASAAPLQGISAGLAAAGSVPIAAVAPLGIASAAYRSMDEEGEDGERHNPIDPVISMMPAAASAVYRVAADSAPDPSRGRTSTSVRGPVSRRRPREDADFPGEPPKRERVLQRSSKLFILPVAALFSMMNAHPERLNDVYRYLLMMSGFMSLVGLGTEKVIYTRANSDDEARDVADCVAHCDLVKCSPVQMTTETQREVYQNIFRGMDDEKERVMALRLATPSGRTEVGAVLFDYGPSQHPESPFDMSLPRTDSADAHAILRTDLDGTQLAGQTRICYPKHMITNLAAHNSVEVVRGSGERWEVVGLGRPTLLGLDTYTHSIFVAREAGQGRREYAGSFMPFGLDWKRLSSAFFHGAAVLRPDSWLAAGGTTSTKGDALTEAWRALTGGEPDDRAMRRMQTLAKDLPEEVVINRRLLRGYGESIRQAGVVDAMRRDALADKEVFITLYGFSLAGAGATIATWLFGTAGRALVPSLRPPRFAVFGSPRVLGVRIAEQLHRICDGNSVNVTAAPQRRGPDGRAYLVPDPVALIPTNTPSFAGLTPHVLLAQNARGPAGWVRNSVTAPFMAKVEDELDFALPPDAKLMYLERRRGSFHNLDTYIKILTGRFQLDE